MGACCSCHRGGGHFDGYFGEEEKGREVIREREGDNDDNIIMRGDGGALVRLQGSSKYVSMFTQQGRKGLNQDALTVWESFGGERDMFLCGVFDGHGPSGHKVAQYVRDVLPEKISSSYNQSCISLFQDKCNKDIDHIISSHIVHDDDDENPVLSSWKDRLIKCFHETDEQLEADPSVESYCSGTTSVTALKKGEHLIIANLGDSRAVMGTRDENNQLCAEQLTVDLKPNIAGEMERITSRQGRVMAMDEEPKVYRVWMPHQNCPGLAMSRAFGDFCLKDFGLISTPQVTYRKLSQNDEFVVLATDGIWDVLSNNEVVKIVASARKRSMAAKLLIHEAVKAWRYKFPCAKTDDCAVICLFFKRQRPLLTKSISEVTHLSLNYTELSSAHHHNGSSCNKSDDGLDTVLNCQVNDEDDDDADHHNHEDLSRPRKRRPAR